MRNLLYVFALFFVLTVLFSSNSTSSAMSAREIDANCDVVLFTTQSCGYCKQAKNMLAKTEVAWCEKDIENSKENLANFKSLGGRGVPVMVAGDKILKGYNEQIYKKAIAEL